MVKIIRLLYIFSIISLLGCQKDDDITENVTVQGMVRNNCTGEGFANVSVKFYTRTNKSVNTISTITDANGNFKFTGLNVNNSNDYTYGLLIESYTNLNEEFFGIGPIDIDKNKLTNFHTLGISASFKILNFILPSATVINSPDSFKLNLEQVILHRYEPWRIWQVNMGAWTNIDNNTIINLGNYPMGWWHITINKRKGGVQSIINDSIYLNMGATSSYTIPW